MHLDDSVAYYLVQEAIASEKKIISAEKSRAGRNAATAKQWEEYEEVAMCFISIELF